MSRVTPGDDYTTKDQREKPYCEARRRCVSPLQLPPEPSTVPPDCRDVSLRLWLANAVVIISRRCATARLSPLREPECPGGHCTKTQAPTPMHLAHANHDIIRVKLNVMSGALPCHCKFGETPVTNAKRRSHPVEQSRQSFRSSCLRPRSGERRQAGRGVM